MQAVNAIFFSHCLMLCNAILTCCKLLHLSVVFITNFYIKLWYVTNPCSFSYTYNTPQTHPHTIEFIDHSARPYLRRVCTSVRRQCDEGGPPNKAILAER